MKKRLLIMMIFLPEYRRKLTMLAPNLEIVYCEKQAPTADDLKQAAYIWGNPSKEQLAQCEKLEWLQLQTAGYDAYTGPGILPEGVILCSCSGAYGLTISEYLLSSTLAITKKLHLYRDQQHEHQWRNLGRITIIAKSSVLVVGIGDIGSQYARKMHALGARVSGIRSNIGEKPDYLEALYTMDHLDQILSHFDIVALCLPNNPQTIGLFSRERLARMKKGAILLNVGRGTAVDTDALCDALESGALGGAGLDVMDPEPLPADHRLWDTKQALITPHAAGGDAFGEIYPSIIVVWFENLHRYRTNEPLLNQIQSRYEVKQ